MLPLTCVTLVLVCVAASCTDSTKLLVADIDSGPAADLAPPPLPPDACVDLADLRPADLHGEPGRWDFGPPLPVDRVVYLTGGSIKLVNVSGGGKQSVPGLPPSLRVGSIELSDGLSQIGPHTPRIVDHGNMTMGVQLPGALGALYHVYTSGGKSSSHLLHIGPHGTVRPLLALTPGGSVGYNFSLACLPDGTLCGVQDAQPQAVLFRTDGKAFPNGSPVCRLWGGKNRGVGTPALAANHAYFVAATSGYLSTVYRVLRDCSAPAQKVALPAFGTKPAQPKSGFIVSEDGSAVGVVVSYGSSDHRAWVVIADATGKASRLSPVSSIHEPGKWPLSSVAIGAAKAALSPRGKAIGWVDQAYVGVPSEELFVRPNDATAIAPWVTRDAFFSPKLDMVDGLLWANDDVLLFLARGSVGGCDIFAHSLSTGFPVNLTQTGGTTKPFVGGGNVDSGTAWVGPTGAWIYYTRGSGANNDRGLYAIHRTSLQTKTILKGEIVKRIAAAPAGSRVFLSTFSGRVYAFDQGQASTAALLADFSTGRPQKQWIASLAAADDGSSVVAVAGSLAVPSPGKIHVVSATPKPAVVTLTPAPVFVHTAPRFTTDGKAVVYAEGTPSLGAARLLVAPISGGAHMVLDTSSAMISILAVTR